MSMIGNELSLDELENVCGSGFGIPVVTGLKHSPSLGRSGTSGSSGDGDGAVRFGAGSTGGGYKGDDNYLRPF
jgi:hypothetical protein